ncbi:hypothetical protein ACVWW1_004301 [Bradyrhizobium sp. JR3.5]
MRPSRFGKPDCTISGPGRHVSKKRHRPLRVSRADAQWTLEANVRRYRRPLNTQLTDVERSFIKRRLIVDQLKKRTSDELKPVRPLVAGVI